MWYPGSMASYSLDLRLRVVAKYDDGFSYEDVGEQFSVHPNTVRRWVKRRDELGHFEDKPHGGAPPKKLDEEDLAELRRIHEEDQDAYLREFAERLAARRGKPPVSLATIDRALQKMGITRKKNTSELQNKMRPKSRRHDTSTKS